MAYNYEYPYTDMHRHNDDWMLNKIKELVLEWTKLSGECKHTNQEVENLKEYVTNYFSSLNVSAEIAEQLSEMVENGLIGSIVITPQMFGAGGAGKTDDTQAINEAIALHNETGLPIYFPKGIYLVYGRLDAIETEGIVFGSGDIRGFDETGETYIFIIKANVTLSGLTMRSSGYGGTVLIDGTRGAVVEGCTINSDKYGITINNSSLCSVKDCYIVNATRAINISSIHPDTGDNYFTGNTFDCSDGANKSALLFNSGGGIRFINNKVLSYEKGIHITSTGDTSVLVIDGNSFENGTYCMLVDNSERYGRIIFSNNQVTKYCIRLLKNTYEVQIVGNIFTGVQTENSICCTMDDVQGKVSFENNIVNGYRYGVYSYRDITNLKISNNNYDDYCKKAENGNKAIFDETYDKIITTSGGAFTLGRVVPALNGSCIVEVMLSGATNAYAIIRQKNVDGSVSAEKIHGDFEFTCNASGVFVGSTSGSGETYVHVGIRGCVKSVEI